MTNIDIKQLRKRIYDNKELNKLIQKANLSDQDIDQNILAFLAYFSSETRCSTCKNLNDCSQSQQGKKITLVVNEKNKQVNSYFTSCAKLKEKEKDKGNQLFVLGYNFDEVEKSNLYLTEERKKELDKIKKIISNVKNGLPTKGLFLSGAHGRGKSYIMAYIAKELVENGQKVDFLFYPDLVRKIKSNITTGKIEDIIDELKTVDVLMLDDFGAETSSNFIRDEILGPILQDRMNNNLLTFMTSNLSEDNIIEHLKETTNQTDNLKATRIYTRIKALMEFVEIKGSDYRDSKKRYKEQQDENR